MTTISKKAFIAQFKNTTIDARLPSKELKDALGNAGVPLAALQSIAGPDGRIKSASEFAKLFQLLDGFDGKPDQKLDLGATGGAPVATLCNALASEVAANRRYGIYNPGREVSAPHRQKTDADALVVAPKDRKKTVALDVIGKDQFVWGAEHGLDRAASNHVCFNAAEQQTTEFVTRQLGKKAPQLNGADEAIQVAWAEDAAGRVAVDPMQQGAAHDYIDRMLDRGLPVMVGVSVWKDKINHDHLTDHFVTITGRGYDEKGRLFYEFKDPGLNGTTGRFFVDAASGSLYRPLVPTTGRKTVRNFDYELTQVRTWRGIE
ncbi:MAG: hypothetical protein ACOZQL_36735 [Myxococcota bacterium]